MALYNRLKSWAKSYLFFQDLNYEVDNLYAACNDLEARKVNNIAVSTLAQANMIAKRDAEGKLAGDILGNAGGSAANVTTNINDHAIADILEEDGVTAKKATTGPDASAGFPYLVHDGPYQGTYFGRTSSTGFSDVNTWLTVGPTGSGANIIWTELDSLPSSTKAICINVYANVGGPAGVTGDLIRCRFSANVASPSGIISVLEARVQNPPQYAMATNTVKVKLDANKIFKFYYEKAGTGGFHYLQCFLQEYYL